MTTFVVGLDGADWSLLDQYADTGDLPAFDRLRTKGTTGNMKTTFPPVTSPAWQCFATGKNPGKLGVYGWMTFNHDSQKIDFADASKFQSDRFWDVLARNGHRVGVINVPTTYPPECEDGVSIIAGNGTLRDNDFTSSQSLKSELLERIPEYRIMMRNSINKNDPTELITEATTLFDQRFDAARWLADEKDCDVVIVTLFHTDTVQHSLWNEPETMRPMYEHIDRHLGQLLDDDDTEGVFLLSDHGFQELETVFLPNQWLLERGDITIRESNVTDSSRRLLHRLGITREQFMHLFDRLGIEDLMARLVPQRLKRAIPHDDTLLPIQEADVDWSETRAVSLGLGSIYLNSAAFDSESARTAYIDELKTALKELKAPTGHPVANQVYYGEEIWDGDRGDQPDLFLDYTAGIDGSKVGIGGTVFNPDSGSKQWVGQHGKTGIFAAYGAGIEAGTVDVSIYDIAPTIIHYLNAPVPEDVDGTVQQSVFTDRITDREIERGPPTATDTDVGEAQKEVEETLKDLGYL